MEMNAAQIEHTGIGTRESAPTPIASPRIYILESFDLSHNHYLAKKRFKVHAEHESDIFIYITDLERVFRQC